MLTPLKQDLQFAIRQLRRSPGFSITAVLTLALGIGANTAIFSLLDQALLRSLPVHAPGELVHLEGSGTAWNGRTWSHGGPTEAYFSYPMYLDLRDRTSNGGAQPFTALIATIPAEVGVSRGETSDPYGIELVSGNYFSTLGVEPALGRTFTEAEDLQPNAVPVAVLSYDFWRNHLAADPNIVNSTLKLNGHPYTVLGVAAPSFHSVVWGETPAMWVPMHMIGQIMPGEDSRLTDHTIRWLNILGRRRPGVSDTQANAALAPLWHALRTEELKSLQPITPRFAAEYATNSRLTVHSAARGFSYKRDEYQTPFLAVMAMALLVLGISAVNVASLLLVRAAGRVREFSLRAALGAGVGRILGQLLLEGLMIGVLGGTVGVLMAPLALRVLVARLTDQDGLNPFSASLDARVLLFNFAVAVGVSLVFSLVPALQLRHLRLSSTLRESSGTLSGTSLMLRRVVVCLQVGLSVLLLVASGLFLRTLDHLRKVELGFNPVHLVSFAFDPTLAGYTPAQAPTVQQRVINAMAALPGVASVAATNDPEMEDNSAFTNVVVAGYNAPSEDRFQVENSAVTPGYFDVLGLKLVAGRALTPQDDETHPHVAVVNQSFSKHFCGSPTGCLGRRLGLASKPDAPTDTEIVGITHDARHTNLRDQPVASMFRPLKQVQSNAAEAALMQTPLTVYLRTLADPAAIIASVRRSLHATDPGLSAGEFLTMDQQIDADLGNDRLIALLAVGFGALATVLAAVGLYGVLAYATAQRTREIGIRMALGSSRLAVSSLILRDVLQLAAIGVVVALPVAWGLGRLLRAQLFGVTAADPVVLASAVGIITLAALVAALIPARRAASIEPVYALRTE